jgi:hypothetical protein
MPACIPLRLRFRARRNAPKRNTPAAAGNPKERARDAGA